MEKIGMKVAEFLKTFDVDEYWAKITVKSPGTLDFSKFFDEIYRKIGFWTARNCFWEMTPENWDQFLSHLVPDYDVECTTYQSSLEIYWPQNAKNPKEREVEITNQIFNEINRHYSLGKEPRNNKYEPTAEEIEDFLNPEVAAKLAGFGSVGFVLSTLEASVRQQHF